MKKSLVLLMLSFLAFSCSEKELETDTSSRLTGTWKAVEVFSTDGGSSPEWNTFSGNFEYSFIGDEVITNNLEDGCEKGTFGIKEGNIIQFNFPCNSFQKTIEILTDTELILVIDNFEPLKFKFKKI
jgi:hypothetical protein